MRDSLTGRTLDSDSGSLGSYPSLATKEAKMKNISDAEIVDRIYEIIAYKERQFDSLASSTDSEKEHKKNWRLFYNVWLYKSDEGEKHLRKIATGELKPLYNGPWDNW